MSAPAVSIICATYNRAEVLRYAIQSVLRSEFRDWELIVIGDGCTDHSESVVAGFEDSRITMENLAENSGGQATPNNRGAEKARGHYVFFLNQDDMYLPDHIGSAVAFLDESNADFIWCPAFVLQHSGSRKGPADPAYDTLWLDGAVDDCGFDPNVFVVASTWSMRRETCVTVGPWSSEKSTRFTPSQDWLFRASRRGVRMIYHPRPSVLCVHAGVRRLSYAMKTSTVHERCWSWIAGGPESYRKIVDCLAINQSKALYRQAYAARSQIDRQTRDLASAFNVHPKELEGFLQGLAAGDWIRRIRKYTSEAEPIALNQTVAAGENAATVYLSNGWHSGEQNLRWTCEEAAYIHFSIDASDQDLFLRLRVATLRPDIPVTFLVDGQPTVIQRFAAPSDVILPLGRRTGLVEVEIRLDTCVSPKDLGLSEDWRSLGVALYEFELETQRE